MNAIAQRLDNLTRVVKRKITKRRLQKQSAPVKRQSLQKPSKRGGVKIKRVPVLILVTVVVGLIGYLVVTLSQISFPQYAKTNSIPPSLVVGNRLNILCFVYENVSGFDFVDAVMVLSINADESRVAAFFINQDFHTRVLGANYIPIRNLLSNAEVQKKVPYEELKTLAQDTLGLPVDRYIAVSRSNFKDLLANVGIFGVTAVDEVDDLDAGIFRLGQHVELERVAAYLAADAGGNNKKMTRASKLFVQMTESINWTNVISSLFNAQGLAKYVNTDMTGAELLNITNLVMNAANVRAEFVSINDAYLIETKLGNVLVPNLIKVDDKVRAVMGRQRVVREQARLEVYNATGENGLATRFKRQIFNYGGNVIRAGNYPERVEQTVLYAPQGTNFPQTITLVKELTRNKVEIREENYPFNHTAELVLVLGADVVQ